MTGGSYIGDVKFCIILINRRKRGDNTLGGGLLGGRKGSTGDKQERGGGHYQFLHQYSRWCEHMDLKIMGFWRPRFFRIILIGVYRVNSSFSL